MHTVFVLDSKALAMLGVVHAESCFAGMLCLFSTVMPLTAFSTWD